MRTSLRALVSVLALGAVSSLHAASPAAAAGVDGALTWKYAWLFGMPSRSAQDATHFHAFTSARSGMDAAAPARVTQMAAAAQAVWSASANVAPRRRSAR